MSSKMNPYGVGYSSNEYTDVDTRCGCCRAPFRYRRLATRPEPRRWCDRCADHHPVTGEDESRELERLRDHELRLWDFVDQAKAAAKAAHDQRDEARQQVRAALESRDRWREMMSEVWDAHTEVEDNQCSCGMPFPCTTAEIVRGYGGRSGWLRAAATRRHDRRELDEDDMSMTRSDELAEAAELPAE